MIEGLHADVATDELATLLRNRADQHAQRAVFYRDKAKGLDMTGHSMDPARELLSNADKHVADEALLRFYADHLAPGEIYRLDRQDLSTLGIKAERY